MAEEKQPEQYHNIRREYKGASLTIDDVFDDPVEQFSLWFDQAVEGNLRDPNAMTLATADAEGRPSARIVLLKGVEAGSFSFYTNYNSRKSKELLENAYAALVFFWPEHERQVRIEGVVQKLSEEASRQYFQSRPRQSQIGAIASPQSQIIQSREELETKVNEVNEQFANQDQLPRPDHWGGFLLQPHRIEFWQGRESRLHDRIEYTLQKNKAWQVKRLAP